MAESLTTLLRIPPEVRSHIFQYVVPHRQTFSTFTHSAGASQEPKPEDLTSIKEDLKKSWKASEKENVLDVLAEDDICHKVCSFEPQDPRARLHEYQHSRRKNSLFQVNRQLRLEGASYYYGGNTFRSIIGVDKDYETIQQYFQSRSELSRANVRNWSIVVKSRLNLCGEKPIMVEPSLSSSLELLKNLPHLTKIDVATVASIDSCKRPEKLIDLFQEIILKFPPHSSLRLEVKHCEHCVYWRKQYEHDVWKGRQSWFLSKAPYVGTPVRIDRHIGATRESNSFSVSMSSPPGLRSRSLSDNILKLQGFALPQNIADAIVELPRSFEIDTVGGYFDITTRLLRNLHKLDICRGCETDVKYADMLEAQCPSCELLAFCEQCRTVRHTMHFKNCIKITRTEEEKAFLGEVKTALHMSKVGAREGDDFEYESSD